MTASSPVRAITFDYWDTLYEGVTLPARVQLRRSRMGELLAAYGKALPPDELDALYRSAAIEAERWWREEQRGYTTAERIRWMLRQIDVQPPEDCEHLARAVAAVDAAMLEFPPTLLAGAAEAIRALAARVPLAIVSDTGFASGRAQDLVLEHHGLRDCFAATIYSMDVGHAKPRPEPFVAAAHALEVEPRHIVHVGDNERTDVRGALAAGFRAVRIDAVRRSGASEAELVALDFATLRDYLESLLDDVGAARVADGG